MEFKIYHNTNVKLDFRNRLRVLFNGVVKTESTIYVDNEVGVVRSEAGTITKNIFPRKEKSICLEHRGTTEVTEIIKGISINK